MILSRPFPSSFSSPSSFFSLIIIEISCKFWQWIIGTNLHALIIHKYALQFYSSKNFYISISFKPAQPFLRTIPDYCKSVAIYWDQTKNIYRRKEKRKPLNMIVKIGCNSATVDGKKGGNQTSLR